MRFSLLIIYLLLLGIIYPTSLCGQTSYYQSANAYISFFSSAPVEDIEAVSNSGVSVLNTANGNIAFKVKIRTFEFEKALMQEHFNENYLESEKYPEATLRGNLLENIDLESVAPQAMIIKGSLEVHGVVQEREIPVTLRVSEDKRKISLNSEFDVACEDHNIKIPKLLWKNIAEVVKVKVKIDYKIKD